MKKKVEILVSGKVQGVFYRASTRDKAMELGLRGNVRNLPDGRVRVIVSGESSIVDQFISWCAEGPRNAKVDDLIVHQTTEETKEGFNIVR